MFLKKLYKFNRFYFYALLFSSAIYLYINYKRGAIATPFFQFGMFSSKAYTKDTQNVFTIYVNDKVLDVSKYAFAKRDMLLTSLQNYEQQKITNEAIFKTMKKIPDKLGLSNLMRSSVYANDITDITFTKWYLRLVQQITNIRVLKIAVYKQKYVWQNSKLIEIPLPEKTPFIVTN